MIRFIVEKSIFCGRDENGKEHFIAQLTADESSELAGVTELNGRVFEAHSVALCADGVALMLKSTGVWNDLSDGSEVPTA